MFWNKYIFNYKIQLKIIKTNFEKFNVYLEIDIINCFDKI